MSGAPPADPDDCLAVEEQLRAAKAHARELASLLMLPALWRGRSPEEIIAGIPKVLINVVRADGVFVRMDTGDGSEVRFHPEHRQDLRAVAEEMANAADGVREEQIADDVFRFVKIATADNAAVVVVTARRSGFPTAEDGFLLRSALDLGLSAMTTASALRQAVNAERRKDEFLAMLSHELRNPLAPIVTALHLMKARDHSDSDRERDIIERQIQHMSRLVDDLLDVSRIVRGQLQLSKSPLDVRAVVKQALEMASPLFEKYGHHVSSELPEEPLVVEGDGARLAQVVANLLVNASRYTPAGGRIAIVVARSNDDVEIRVRDNGRGIAPANRERIFDLFVRTDADKNRGLGLGLPIVRTLVSLHGGTVTASSAGIGLGSEFVIRLPVSTQSIVEPGRDLSSRKRRTQVSPRKVLLVDDNEDAAEMLAETLQLDGHEVRVAHDGPTALACSKAWQYDVALLDIGLPVMDGYELVRKLKEQREMNSARYYALTGYGQETDRARAREAGFDDHFIKPIDVKTLLGRLIDEPKTDA